MVSCSGKQQSVANLVRCTFKRVANSGKQSRSRDNALVRASPVVDSMQKAYRGGAAYQEQGAAMSVEKITIALTPEMAGFVRNSVNAGEYASASEAIRDAVREWQERRDLLGYTTEELRELVMEGSDSRQSSRLTMADVKAEARRRFEASQRRD